MGNRTRRHDDVDDFMANILGSGASSSSPSKQNHPHPKPSHKQRPEAQKQPQTVKDDSLFTSIDMDEHRPANKKRSAPKIQTSTLKKLALIPVIVAVAVGLFFLWKGPISSLLSPSSPFSDEVKQSAGITLYFPSRPPTGFKIDVDTTSRPGQGVVMFAMTNDSGGRIIINQQKKPSGVSLDPLFAALSDIQTVQTAHGEVKIGTSSDNITVANVFIDNTWLIINSSDGSLTTESLKTIVDGLKS